MRRLPFFLLCSACSVFAPPPEPLSPPDATMLGVVMDQWREGTLDSQTFFETLSYHREESRAEGQALVSTPIEAGASTGTLKANEATIFMAEGKATLRGDVDWLSRDGDRARTQYSDVDWRKGWAEGPMPLHLEGADYEVEGARFEAQLKGERRLWLHEGVEGWLGEEAP